VIGYLAIGDPWSAPTGESEKDTVAEAAARLQMSRVHGYPHPTLFKGVRNAFRAIRERYDYIARTPGENVHGHLRILDLGLLPIVRFEDLSLVDRRAIITTKSHRSRGREATSEAMLQRARDTTVPDIIVSDADELYEQLQVAERQMQIWEQRTARIRQELEYVKYATPVQKAKRRRRLDAKSDRNIL
jgi:hypothetical protein